MIVGEDRGEKLVQESIRQIMASRAIHNVFRSPECALAVTQRHLDLADASSDAILARFDLRDIAFWMTHKENDRLFAFISRAGGGGGGGEARDAAEFRCHVFESATSAAPVASVLTEATKAAYQEYLASLEQPPWVKANIQKISFKNLVFIDLRTFLFQTQ